MGGFAGRLGWVLAAAALAAVGCGAPNSAVTSTRELQSLTIAPAAATANGGAVQFTATGHWSESPLTVTPQGATWGVCSTGNVPSTEVTVSSTGLATCGAGVKGTYDVFAWDPQYGYTGPVCLAITACGPGCGRVSDTVQLTCP